MKRNNEGFTLIELVVALAASVSVMAAAFTVLLLGARVEGQTTELINDRQSINLQMASLDSLVQDSRIDGVEINGDDWTLYSTDDDGESVEVMKYDSNTETIKSSNGVELSGVSAKLDVSDGKQLLKLDLETEKGAKYSLSVRCHTAIKAEKTNSKAVLIELRDNKEKSIFSSIVNDLQQQQSRYNFVTVMATQYGSTGEIFGDKKFNYFSEWYNSDWPSDTPWCACFVSWALEKAQELGVVNGEVPRFAGVKNGVELFKELDHTYGAWKSSVYYLPDQLDMLEKGKMESELRDYIAKNEYTPLPGDLIFFDWSDDENRNYDHVGAVLYAENGKVYTIEGNSNNRVAIRGYDLNDPCIIGYGVINWVKDSDVESGK